VVDVLLQRGLLDEGEAEEWKLGPEVGISAQEIDRDLPDGIDLPPGLRSYYLVAGRHPVNHRHNRLRPVAQLEVDQHRVVFLDENQGVVFWGIAVDDEAADPIVWQGQPATGDRPTTWYCEDTPLTAFLSEMWRFTVTGEN